MLCHWNTERIFIPCIREIGEQDELHDDQARMHLIPWTARRTYHCSGRAQSGRKENNLFVYLNTSVACSSRLV